jgi:short-subunit dehydrogenase
MLSEALAAEEKKMASMCLPFAQVQPRHRFMMWQVIEGTFLTKIMDSPETVAKTALRAMKCACHSSVVTGVMNKPLPLINRLMPRQCMTWIAGKLTAR